jgi:hypothetical protein
MSAIQHLVEGRNALRREFDRLNRASDKAAVEGDEKYELSANLAAQAVEVGESIKTHEVAINALGGEPKVSRSAKKKATAAA